MAQIHQPLRPLDTNKEPEIKKKREKLSALCKTPPALIRNKVGKDYERGLCLGEVSCRYRQKLTKYTGRIRTLFPGQGSRRANLCCKNYCKGIVKK